VTGHIRLRGPKRYSIVIDLPKKSDGSRQQKWFKFNGTLAQAERYMTGLLHEINKGVYREVQAISFRDYADEWIANPPTPLQTKTAERYAEIIRTHFVPELGLVMVRDLTAKHTDLAFTHWRRHGNRRTGRGLSETTLRHYRHLLKAMLADAVDRGYAATNPMHSERRKVQPKQTSPKMEVLTAEQVHTLVEEAKNPWRANISTEPRDRTPSRVFANNRLAYAVEFAVRSGLRRGEICGLKWSDLDFKKSTITVQRSLEETEGGVFEKSTKNDGIRSFKLGNRAMMVLAAQRSEQNELKKRLGKSFDDKGYVFSEPLGGFWKPEALGKAFVALLTRMRKRDPSFPRVRLHDLRHTCATLLIEAGVPLKTVSGILGHSTIAITADLYGHRTAAMDDAAAKAMDSV
jgi:integrase